MTSKLNIFNALPAGHHSEDEDEFDVSGDNTKPKEKRVRNRGKKQDAPETTTARPTGHVNGREHELKKAGNDLENPHRLERQSGTGVSAYNKKDKKNGGGKGNWGNYKDDSKRTKEDGEETQEVELPVNEEEDKTITFDEYIGNKGSNAAKTLVNDVKAKISDEQLKKELGKATLLETRKTIKNDDKQETHKRNEATAITGMNTEHANLLGFRTGFKTYDDSKKRDFNNRGEKRDYKPRNKDETEGSETAKPTEETEQTAQTEQAAEVTPVEGEQTAEGAETSPSQQRGHRGSRRGGNRGGFRGENGEGRTERGAYRGSRRGGDRREGGERREGQGERKEGQGERKPYAERKEGQGEKKEYQGERREAQGAKGGYRGNNNKAAKGFNVEDESAFPKLG